MSNIVYQGVIPSLTQYLPPGPVGANFLNSEARIRFVMGPWGSGKTTLCLFDMVRWAGNMPVATDGKRHYRGIVVRDTFRNLYKTTIRSWWNWFPKDIGVWTGGEDRPAVHKFDLECIDRHTLDFELQFAALGNDTVENVLKGWEGTQGYMNEADLTAQEGLDYLYGRCGRYPSVAMLGGRDVPRGVIGDLNPPDTENWVYKRFVEEPRPLHAFFHQPSGLAPNAENIQNLPKGYYEDLIATNDDWWCQRNVYSKWGYSRDGDPVYPDFDQNLHVAAHKIEPVDRPIRIGFDSDLHPAAIIGQVMPNLQVRILQEIVPGRMGYMRFGELVRQVLNDDYRGLDIEMLTVDPSSEYGADEEGGELAWLDGVSNILNKPLIPAPTNELRARLEAVSGPLSRLVDGGQPEILISPNCKVLIKGFMSDYRYRRIRVGNTDRFEDKPEKNAASHPHDALQYHNLGIYGWLGVTRRQDKTAHQERREKAAARRAQAQQQPMGDFNVFDY